MKVSRRQFITGSSLLALSQTVPVEAKIYLRRGMGGSAFNDGLPVLQGRTDKTSASIIIQHPSQPKFFVQAKSSMGDHTQVQLYDSFKIPNVKHQISEYTISGLHPAKTYNLTITNEDGKVVDQRTFSSLDTDKKQSRIAMASCMNDSNYFDGFGISSSEAWRQVALQKPDLVILTGDTCYADQNLLAIPILSHSKERLAERYFETRARLGWFRQPHLIPTIATWDDHDFGTNNGNKYFHLKSDVKFLFEVFWGRRENSIHKNSFGVSSYAEAFGQRFFLLDDRSFRDPKNAKSGYWGGPQKDWLIGALSSSTKPSWLINGNQFFGGYLKKESFEYNYRSDFQDLLQQLKKAQAPIVFASGDVHFSEVMEIEKKTLGYSTYEFTSSSIHSFGHRGKRKNPRRVAAEEKHNFLVFDIDTSKHWNIKARCFQTDGKPSFSKDVEIVRS